MTWIPHTISRSLLQLFTRQAHEIEASESDETWWLDAYEDGEEEEDGWAKAQGVRVHAAAIRYDDFGWADRTPRPLRHLSVDAIARDFARYPPQLFEWITPANAAYLAETLDTGLPVPSVVHVPCPEYWRRRYADHWSADPDVACFGPTDPWPDPPDSVPSPMDWWPASVDPLSDPRDLLRRRRRRRRRRSDPTDLRALCLTRHVTDAVEDMEPGRGAAGRDDELAALLDACSPHVTALVCARLRGRPSEHDGLPDAAGGRDAFDRDPVHADLAYVLGRLRNVRDVRLTYGPRFNVLDMDTLGRALSAARGRLVGVAVTDSDLDAHKFDRLRPYLEQCAAVERVDFSRCRLRSAGVASVARYSQTAQALRRVDLCDNDAGPDGVEALAYAAVVRTRDNGHPAVELNLSMNRIKDIGAKYLASALASGVQPFTKLRIRNCNISEIGGMNITQSLAYDQGLRTLEIDNNKLSLEVAVALHKIMKMNSNITYLSTQNCDFPETVTNFFRNVAFHNRYDKRSDLTYVDIENLYNGDNEENVSQEEVITESKSDEEDSNN